MSDVCKIGASERKMVFRKAMFREYVGPRVKARKDQHWREICHLAGVAPEYVQDVDRVEFQMGEGVVILKEPKPAPADDLISKMERANPFIPKDYIVDLEALEAKEE